MTANIAGMKFILNLIGMLPVFLPGTLGFESILTSSPTRLSSTPQVISFKPQFRDSIHPLTTFQDSYEAYNTEFGISSTMDFLWFSYRDRVNDESMFHTTYKSEEDMIQFQITARPS